MIENVGESKFKTTHILKWNILRSSNQESVIFMTEFKKKYVTVYHRKTCFAFFFLFSEYTVCHDANKAQVIRPKKLIHI